MSSDRTFRRIGLFSGLALLALVSGCQVRPLYSEAGGTGERLASVGFDAQKGRVAQVIRNHLVFLTSGGAGEARNPAYDVNVTATSTSSSIIDDVGDSVLSTNGNATTTSNISASGVPIPGRVAVTANYTLTRLSDGKVLKSASRQVVSQIDIGSQSFAKQRATRDAEDRASRELAEFIRAEIAIALANEPQPQTAWQK